MQASLPILPAEVLAGRYTHAGVLADRATFAVNAGVARSIRLAAAAIRRSYVTRAVSSSPICWAAARCTASSVRNTRGSTIAAASRSSSSMCTRVSLCRSRRARTRVDHILGPPGLTDADRAALLGDTTAELLRL